MVPEETKLLKMSAVTGETSALHNITRQISPKMHSNVTEKLSLMKDYPVSLGSRQGSQINDRIVKNLKVPSGSPVWEIQGVVKTNSTGTHAYCPLINNDTAA